MTQTRINNSIRHHVIQKLRDLQFKPMEDALERKSTGAAWVIYNNLYTFEEQAIMRSLPDGWLPTRFRMRVRVDGEYHEYSLDKEVRVPESFSVLNVAGNSALGQAIRSLEEEKQALVERKDDALMAARAMLNSHRTVEALLKSWPEVEPFLPKGSEPVVTTALALSAKHLNSLLGLP